MADCVGLFARDYVSFFIERDNGLHSGNWLTIIHLIEKGVIRGHSFRIGYYGDRLKERVLIAPVTPIFRWPDDC